MNDDGKIRHQYYKGLRVINVISHKELVAWEEIQVCFRGEGEEVLSEDDYSILKMLIGLYSKASKRVCKFRELSLGARFVNQRYGFSIEATDFMKEDQFVPFVNEMFTYLLSLDTTEKMKSGLIDMAKLKNIPAEEKRRLAKQLVEGMSNVKSEIETFMDMINNGGKYVYITDVLD